MKKSIFSLVLLLASLSSISQEQTQNKLTKDKELTVVVGMATTKFKNTNLTSDQYLTIDKKNGIDFVFEYSKYIKNRIGFGIGLGYSTYGQSYYEKGWFELANQTDKDGDKFDRLIKADVTYTDKLSYLNIPITLHLLLGNSPRFYGFVDVGINNQFLISGVHTEEGSLETMNRYPSQYYNVDYVMHNYPEYGTFYTPVSKKSDERYKFYNMSVRVAVGIAAAMTDRLFLKVQPFMNYGLSDITGPDDKGKDYENVLGEKSGYSKTSLFSAGINVGFAFNLN